MVKNSRRGIRIFILLSLFIVVSCTYSTREQGYVYFRLKTNPTTLDPAYVVDVTGGRLSAKLFNGLVRINANLEIVPDIADHWRISGDGKVYTFYLRRDVMFSNGRRVTAGDFVWSFRRVLDPGNHCPNTWVLDRISGAGEVIRGKSDKLPGLKALNDYTLRIVLDRPFSPFLSLLSMPAAYVVPREEVLRLGDSFGFNPVGTGPYKIREWISSEKLVFESNHNYFEGAPGIRGIIYRIIPEDLTAITEFELGNLDVIGIPASAYRHFTGDPAWKGRIISIKGLNTYYLGLNCSRPPFSDKTLRRAVSYAIDRKKILGTLYEGRGRLASGPVPDNLREWKIVNPYRYSPPEAGKLLKKSGYRLPVKVDFYITSDQDVVDVAEVIQSYLNAAGFDVHIKQLEWSAYKEALNKGEADMFWLSWWADYPDPENFLYPVFHSSNVGPAGNRSRFRNPVVDNLIEKGQAATGRDMRDRFYQKAEQLIIDEAPWVFFWHRNDYLLKQKWVKNLTVSPVYSSDKGTGIMLSEPAGAKN
ncbi:heme-binding protein A precursor [bacterium BMS3Bbin05]|nr:heme-binding protein A precursor [bacterium BMS3Bbin05]